LDTYNYLAVLVSIILGLGITNLLSGFASLVRERSRVRMYSPVAIWMITLFLAHAQMWWAMFALVSVDHWTFAKFLAVLLQPVALFLTSAFIVPSLAGAGPVDLKEQFIRESRWLGCGLFGMLAASAIKNFVIEGHMEPLDIAAHAGFAIPALATIFVRNDLVIRIIAPLTLLALLVYTGFLFADLGKFG
jgi:hypothetical protein